MEHRYDIVLDGHMGERFGTLVWSEADGIVSGVFFCSDLMIPSEADVTVSVWS